MKQLWPCFFVFLLILGNPALAKMKHLKENRSFAFIIAHNQGGKKVAPLRYAESDAHKMKQVLHDLGGFQKDNIRLVVGKNSSVVRKQLLLLKQRILRIKKKKGSLSRVLVLLYYSGHAKKGQLLLGNTTLALQDIRDILRTMKADIKLAIIDACESGSLTRMKGLRHSKKTFPIPSIYTSPTVKGEVFITATGSQESAHEDPELKGGVFTHYLVSGLRGNADFNKDKQISLEEMYHYAYRRSLERTLLSVHGPQRAHFQKKLSGYGRLILTNLSRPESWVVLQSKIHGSVFVWNSRKNILLAELNKKKGQKTLVALNPGHYVLQWRSPKGLYSSSVQLVKGQTIQVKLRGKKLAYQRKGSIRGTTQKGGHIDEWVDFENIDPKASFLFQYQIGGMNPIKSTLFQGAQLLFDFPLAGSSRWSLFFQVGYLYGTSEDKLFSTFHNIPIHFGSHARLVQTSKVTFGLGLRAEVVPIFQEVTSPASPTSSQTTLSFAFGGSVGLHLRWKLSSRWFFQADGYGGALALEVNRAWQPRWNSSLLLGFGRQF